MGTRHRALLARLRHDQRGTTLPEFTILMGVFLGMTFMLFEFGFALYQWVATEKATQLGARIAAVRDPTNAANGVLLDPAQAARFGTWCWAIGGCCVDLNDDPTDGCEVPVAGVVESCTNCGTAGYTRIVTALQSVAPFIDPGVNCDVVVEYRVNPSVGFVGGPFVGEVEVSIENYTFNFVTLQAFSTFLGGALDNALPMPVKSTTIVTEDLNSSGA